MSKISNWKLDIRRMTIVRRRDIMQHKLGSFLVRPQSQAAQAIHRIFSGFEDIDKMTIYTVNGSLHVEMKRLDLDFQVTGSGRLRCKQLGAFVSRHQDFGALFGLESGIVMENAYNWDRKSLILPVGIVQWKRHGMHVKVHIVNEGQYTRFNINDVLGRLECPPEPWLLYLKATLHALTSFPIPDDLTGRTGTEEAIHCLLSAQSQPWKPLRPGAIRMLQTLRNLTSIRAWYPDHKRMCQMVVLDPKLTMTVQHDGIAALVDRILIQSRNLASFETETMENEPMNPLLELREEGITHLELRGLIRRKTYERHCPIVDCLIPESAWESTPFRPRTLEKSRDFVQSSARVFAAVRMLREPAENLNHQLPKLVSFKAMYTANAVDLIVGFNDALDLSGLRDLLNINVLCSLGPVIQTCRRGDPLTSFDICLAIGILAFNKDIDEHTLQWMIAVAKNAGLQKVEPPPHQVYRNFRPSEKPTKPTLTTLILGGQSEGEPVSIRKKPKRRKYHQTLDEAIAYLKEKEAEKIAERLLAKWPLSKLDSFETLFSGEHFEYTDLSVAWVSMQEELDRFAHNVDLAEYFNELDNVARSLRGETGVQRTGDLWARKPGGFSNAVELDVKSKSYRLPRLVGGLSLKPCDDQVLKSQLTAGRWTAREGHAKPASSETDVSELMIQRRFPDLSRIISDLVISSDATREQYGRDLHESLVALASYQSRVNRVREPTAEDTFRAVADVRDCLIGSMSSFLALLSSGEIGFAWLCYGNLWPAITTVSLLELLRTENLALLSDDLKVALVSHGLLVTQLQRLLRIQDAQVNTHGHEYSAKRLTEEICNLGHDNWNPEEHPEWLLLEIDSNILIRPSQVEVAWSIISPRSGVNSVLQLNMGQGKYFRRERVRHKLTFLQEKPLASSPWPWLRWQIKSSSVELSCQRHFSPRLRRSSNAEQVALLDVQSVTSRSPDVLPLRSALSTGTAICTPTSCLLGVSCSASLSISCHSSSAAYRSWLTDT